MVEQSGPGAGIGDDVREGVGPRPLRATVRTLAFTPSEHRVEGMAHFK